MLGGGVCGVCHSVTRSYEAIHGRHVDDSTPAFPQSKVPASLFSIFISSRFLGMYNSRVEDLLLFHHDFQLFMLAPPDAVQINVYDTGKLFLFDLVGLRSAATNSRIVDGNIEPAEPPHRLGNAFPYLGRLPHIHL